MLKLGLMFLFGTFSQVIFTIISYHFYFRYAQTTGGVGGTIITNIHPLIWIVIILELIISALLIKSGLKDKSTEDK